MHEVKKVKKASENTQGPGTKLRQLQQEQEAESAAEDEVATGRGTKTVEAAKNEADPQAEYQDDNISVYEEEGSRDGAEEKAGAAMGLNAEEDADGADADEGRKGEAV